MYAEEKETKVEFEGKAGIARDVPALEVENSYGVVLVLATGALIPHNWQGKRVKVTVELIPEPKNCKACTHCFMEPSTMIFTCGHRDAGAFGKYVTLAAVSGGHCGPDRKKFEQHPLRDAQGNLLSGKEKKCSS